jgi:SnoaL-like domain
MSDSDDHEAIRALIHEYAFRIDAGDLDGVAALFEHAELGSSVRPERMRGAAEARRNYTGVILYENGTPETMHCLTNVTITLDGGNRTASARTYFTVIQTVPGFPLQPIIAGQYRDRFQRHAGEWCFSERIIHPDLIGDLSKHMTAKWISQI